MIILPAILESIRSLKDRTYKLTFETNELTPEQLTGVGKNIQRFGYLAFDDKELDSEALGIIKNTKVDFEDNTKTDSQRLRAALYVYYTQDNKGFDSFETFKNHHMEKFINHVKSKLV